MTGDDNIIAYWQFKFKQALGNKYYVLYYKCVFMQDTYICMGICLSNNLFTVLSHIFINLFAMLYQTHLFLLDINTLGDFNFTGIFTTNVLWYAL